MISIQWIFLGISLKEVLFVNLNKFVLKINLIFFLCQVDYLQDADT